MPAPTKKVDQYFEWMEKYKPITNHIGTHGAYENTLFETYGAELDYVFLKPQQTPEKVWTLIEGDEGQYFTAGFHTVNRVGYFITELPWVTGDEEYSNDDEPDAFFEVGDKSYLCDVGYDEPTDTTFIEVYTLEDREWKLVAKWMDKTELPDMDDEDEVEEFTDELSEFLETI